jgi:hypothetical protein
MRRAILAVGLALLLGTPGAAADPRDPEPKSLRFALARHGGNIPHARRYGQQKDILLAASSFPTPSSERGDPRQRLRP